jgi:hypothetical protein
MGQMHIDFEPQEHSEFMRPTAVDAFVEIKESGLLSELRFLVYEAIYTLQTAERGVTSGELDRYISQRKGTWTRSASPRLSELVRLGVIEEMGERPCSVTKQTVIQYRTTRCVPDDKALKRSKPRRPSKATISAGLTEMRRLATTELLEGGAVSEEYQAVVDWLAHLAGEDR